ncbi:MAG: glycoside hydrolase family 3 N-terminal domain-containing protein [Firmicutes bacterium]|nr:glycoside hydrolase family 3 N-terminal domain-containing protein [Bacillota bacterium]
MKKFFCVILCLLLCGCSVQPMPKASSRATLPPEPSAQVTTQPPTQVPTQAPTLPPDPVDLLLSGLTTEEKVGQLFLARCRKETAAEDIAQYHLGGLVLFDRDTEDETPESLRQTLERYQEAATIPLLIAVDEEGGSVARISDKPAFRDAPFSSPRSLYEGGGMEALRTAEVEKDALLSDLGINVNLAPVCDITTDPAAFLYDRSLGQSPELTCQWVQIAVEEGQTYGIGCVLKHFPGYGNNADTHVGIAIENRSLEELEAQDLLPFAAGMEAGCGAVMMSHIQVTALDAEYPASLSPAVHRYVRETMGYNGVLVTDDLVMDAISVPYGVGEAAVLAVLAGNDLLISSDFPEQYAAVLEAIREGRISEEQIDNAVRRVLLWKQSLGLLSGI